MIVQLNTTTSNVRTALLVRQKALKESNQQEKLEKQTKKLEKKAAKTEKKIQKMTEKMEKVAAAGVVVPSEISAELPKAAVSTRCELVVQDDDGQETTLASTAGAEEISLEEKIREAAAKSGIIIPENESPMVAALTSAAKNNAKRNK